MNSHAMPLDDGVRQALHRLVQRRGPDAGREVDRLKTAAEHGQGDALLAAYEAGATAPDRCVELTAEGGLRFMVGVSQLGGSDTL